MDIDMNMKPIGEDLESECVGCGEPLLIGSGDSVNFRMGEEGPEGLLCSKCNSKENNDEEFVVKFHRFEEISCSECGNEINPEDRVRIIMDYEGFPKKFICEGCSSTWGINEEDQ